MDFNAKIDELKKKRDEIEEQIYDLERVGRDRLIKDAMDTLKDSKFFIRKQDLNSYSFSKSNNFKLINLVYVYDYSGGIVYFSRFNNKGDVILSNFLDAVVFVNEFEKCEPGEFKKIFEENVLKALYEKIDYIKKEVGLK